MRWKVFGALGGIGTLLQVVGISSPWWLITQYKYRRNVHGVWYTLKCDDTGYRCTTHFHYDQYNDLEYNFLQFQIESLLSAILLGFATLLGVYFLRHSTVPEKFRIGVISIIIFCLSSIVSFVVVGFFIYYSVTSSQKPSTTVEPPYSVIVYGLAPFISLFLAIKLLPKVRRSWGKIQRFKMVRKASIHKTKMSYDNLYVTGVSMDSLSHSNAGANITPSTSYSTIMNTSVAMTTAKDNNVAIETVTKDADYSEAATLPRENKAFFQHGLSDSKLEDDQDLSKHCNDLPNQDAGYPAVLDPTFSENCGNSRLSGHDNVVFI